MSYLNVQQKGSWNSGDFETRWEATEYEMNLLYHPDERKLPDNPDYRKTGLGMREIITDFFYSGIRKLELSRYPFLMICTERLMWNASNRIDLWNMIRENGDDWITPFMAELHQISEDSILNDEPFAMGKKIKSPRIPIEYTAGSPGKKMYQLVFLYYLADKFLRPVFVKDSETNEVRFSIIDAQTDESLGINIHDVGDEEFYFWIDFSPVVTADSKLSLKYSVEMMHSSMEGKNLGFTGKNSGDSPYIEVCQQMKLEAQRILLELKHKIAKADLPVFSPKKK
jgi:hypothetical protein